jgi:enamine deaminase RidA (YjgF/YER057c/UK114 family)
VSADKTISSGGPWEESIGYSRAVVAGPYIHVSGSTATIDGVLQHEGDAYGQAKVAFQVIEKALVAATMLGGVQFINKAMLVEIEVDSYKP